MGCGPCRRSTRVDALSSPISSAKVAAFDDDDDPASPSFLSKAPPDIATQGQVEVLQDQVGKLLAELQLLRDASPDVEHWRSEAERWRGDSATAKAEAERACREAEEARSQSRQRELELSLQVEGLQHQNAELLAELESQRASGIGAAPQASDKRCPAAGDEAGENASATAAFAPVDAGPVDDSRAGGSEARDDAASLADAPVGDSAGAQESPRSPRPPESPADSGDASGPSDAGLPHGQPEEAAAEDPALAAEPAQTHPVEEPPSETPGDVSAGAPVEHPGENNSAEEAGNCSAEEALEVVVEQPEHEGRVDLTDELERVREELEHVKEERQAALKQLERADALVAENAAEIQSLCGRIEAVEASSRPMQANATQTSGTSVADAAAGTEAPASEEVSQLRRQLNVRLEETEALRDELMQFHAEQGCTPLAKDGWLNLASVVRMMRNRSALRAAAEADLLAAKEACLPVHDAQTESLLERADEDLWWEGDFAESRPTTGAMVDTAGEPLSPVAAPAPEETEPQALPAWREPMAEESDEDDWDESGDGAAVGMRSSQKGVYVFVRFRPCLPHEAGEPEAGLRFEDGRVCTYRARRFRYDAVLGPDATQADVYRLVNLVPSKALDGYSSAVMNYGGTGSGKTYTMVGREQDMGIAPNIARSLLGQIERRRGRAESRGETATYTVTVSMLEIYNECTIDLLQPNCRDVAVRVLGDRVTVEGLVAVPLTSVERVVETVQAGFLARHQASTCGNKESSRGHAVLIFDVRSHRGRAGDVITSESKIFLVDLAGCENLSKAQLSEDALKKLRKKPNPDRAIAEAQETLEREMKRINRSLSTLRKVIEEAASKKGTPMAAICRESKLTLVLRECFGGRNLAVLLCCCSPLEKHGPPTLNSLEFGDVFRRMENAPKAGEITVPDWRLVAEGLRRALVRVDALLYEKSQPVGAEPLASRVVAALNVAGQALLDSDSSFNFPVLRAGDLARAARSALAPLLGVKDSEIAVNLGRVSGREAGPRQLALHVDLCRPADSEAPLPHWPSAAELEGALMPNCRQALRCDGVSPELARVEVTFEGAPAEPSFPMAYGASISAHFVA